jgi:hypothetical protein
VGHLKKKFKQRMFLVELPFPQGLKHLSLFFMGDNFTLQVVPSLLCVVCFDVVRIINILEYTLVNLEY